MKEVLVLVDQAVEMLKLIQEPVVMQLLME